MTQENKITKDKKSKDNLSEAIPDGLHAIAYWLKQLGNGDACGGPGGERYGAIEFFGMKLVEAIDKHSAATGAIADALQELARVIENKTPDTQ